jgi:NAD(P)-dependent dehydrogenase (short-subunit alcohol dehydrogenase family)
VKDELDFTGKTVLVTGSGRNIGRAIVLEFAGRGANVIVNARSNGEEAQAVASEARALGAKALVVMGAAAERETVDTMKREAEAAFGRVDICVSNAARRLYKPFFEVTDEDWHFHLNQQLTASWYLAKAFAPGMKDAGYGRFIHINGPDGWNAGIYRLPHSSAKGALHTMTKGLAKELGPFGITVNDVSPGMMDTIRDPATHPHHTPEYIENHNRNAPIRRQPRPDEVAWACVFLCAPRSAAITGTAIHVDGGTFMLG